MGSLGATADALPPPEMYPSRFQFSLLGLWQYTSCDTLPWVFRSYPGGPEHLHPLDLGVWVPGYGLRKGHRFSSAICYLKTYALRIKGYGLQVVSYGSQVMGHGRVTWIMVR